MNTSLVDKLVKNFKCRVDVISKSDARTSLCGEPRISRGKPGHDKGKYDYFIIPAAQADYIKTVFRGKYEVGDPFAPAVAPEPKQFVCEICGEVFTSNIALQGHKRKHS